MERNVIFSMSSATKQKSSAGKNVLIFFIVFIILEMLIVVGVGRVSKTRTLHRALQATACT